MKETKVPTNTNALDDFKIMKDTLSQAKTDYRGLYQFWFIYGALNLCSYGFARLAASFPENFLIAILYAAENLLSPLLLIIFYIKIFRREYKTANRYYVSCISMWGIPAVIMMENGNTSTTYIAPLFCQICTIVGYFFAAFMVRRAIKKRGDVANGPQ